MPRTIVTYSTIPIVIAELDKWTGKLTWELFCEHIAKVLSEPQVRRHTLIRYNAIKDAFDGKKETLKAERLAAPTKDVTVEFLINENAALKSKCERLERQVSLFQEQFVRWQENIRKMLGVYMANLNQKLDKPMPKVNRA